MLENTDVANYGYAAFVFFPRHVMYIDSYTR